MTQKITLHANPSYKILGTNTFYRLGNLERRMLSHVKSSEPLEIVLDGDNPKNGFRFISHYFYDIIDMLVETYGSWDNVVANVTWELLNGTLSYQRAQFLEDVIGGMKTNVNMEDFNAHS